MHLVQEENAKEDIGLYQVKNDTWTTLKEWQLVLKETFT